MNAFASVSQGVAAGSNRTSGGKLEKRAGFGPPLPIPNPVRTRLSQVELLEAHCKQHRGSACSKSNQVIAPIDFRPTARHRQSNPSQEMRNSS
jgi:hypothetical protein